MYLQDIRLSCCFYITVVPFLNLARSRAVLNSGPMSFIGPFMQVNVGFFQSLSDAYISYRGYHYKALCILGCFEITSLTKPQ